MTAMPRRPRLVHVVDVFVQHKVARIERPLTYAVPSGAEVTLGDVVRVPLGTRDVYGFVVSEMRDAPAAAARLRMLETAPDVPRAFNADGFALARWIAARYCCSLGEALATIVHAAAIPRVVDRFEVVGVPDAQRVPSVPPRLLHLIRDELAARVQPRCAAAPSRSAPRG